MGGFNAKSRQPYLFENVTNNHRFSDRNCRGHTLIDFVY